MGKYILLRKEYREGIPYYRFILECDDLEKIKEKIKSQVSGGGCPANFLYIVKDIPFEFKCAVKLNVETPNIHKSEDLVDEEGNPV